MIIYQDGRFRPRTASPAALPAGVFTTLRLYAGDPVDLAAHAARLADHAARAGLPVPPPRPVLADLIDDLTARNDLGRTDSRLRISFTAESGLGLDPDPLPTGLLGWQADGVPVLTLEARHRRTDRPHLKTFRGLTPETALRAAAAAGCPEAVILGKDGQLLEGIYSNLFLVRDGRPVTPSDTEPILAGRTRQILLALTRDAGFPAVETRLFPADLMSADEAFLANSVREIVPVVAVDARPVGHGRPGPVTRACQELYRDHIRRLSLK